MSINNISIGETKNTSVIDVMADVDLNIKSEVEGQEADFADVIHDVILARVGGRAKLGPGSYNIRLLCVVTQNEDEHVDKTSGIPGQPVDDAYAEQSEVD